MISSIPFEVYRKLPGMNASGLKEFMRSPLHYHHYLMNPKPPTPQQFLGTITHLRILEPEEYAKRVHVIPDLNLRTKAGREDLQAWKDALPDDSIHVTEEQDRLATGMGASVDNSPVARLLLDDGRPELTLTWDREGQPCKARLDWLCERHAAILDIKTAADASPEGFRKAVENFAYHVQASWYLQGAEACGLGELSFVFAVVESKPPHAMAVYELDPEALHRGFQRIEQAWADYLECLSIDTWPGYAIKVTTISLPRWAK